MNKLFILMLVICLVNVHAFVKRDTVTEETPKQGDFLKSLADGIEEAKKNFDPEKLKAHWDEAMKKLQPVIENFVKPAAETKAS